MKKYATFTGRASRSEYWWAALGAALVGVLPSLLVILAVSIGSFHSEKYSFTKRIGEDANGNALFEMTTTRFYQYLPSAALLLIAFVLLIALLIPTYAVLWRRLHDANLAGSWALLSLVPGIGAVAVLPLALLPSNAVGQRFDTAQL